MTDRLYIAIDGGGTGTRVGLYSETGALIAETKGALSNPYQSSPHDAAELVASLATKLVEDRPFTPTCIVAGISGARDQSLKQIFAHTLCARVPGAEQVIVTTDVHAHLIANAGRRSAALVVAGTGSSVAVLDAGGVVSLFGGRGPILGDLGSAYDVVIHAFRSSFLSYDNRGKKPKLLKVLLDVAKAANEDEMIGWCSRATKHEIAALAVKVADLAESGNKLAVRSIEVCAEYLSIVVRGALERTQLGLKAPIYVMGGMFENGYFYRTEFQKRIAKAGKANEVQIAPFIGHAAMFKLSRDLPLPESVPHVEVTQLALAMSETVDLVSTQDDDSAPLDSLNTVMLIERMQRADAFAAAAVKACSEPLALLINRVVKSFRHGGRLVYIGAGTSGRLGVLDASECPPTFGVPPEQVIGIMAGGDRALRDSVEGAEDDADLGRADIEKIDPPICKDDVVVGIAASGTTPYTLGALTFAKSRGAHTALICCNPNATAEVDYLLILPTGPEVLPGSTRLKAGTATKMVLNTITTGAMALSGRVFEGYMIGVQPTNVKLRKRAAHIISVLTGINEEDAARRLEEAGNDVAVAVMMERLKIPADNARELLNKTRGDVRAAIAQYQSGEKKDED